MSYIKLNGKRSDELGLRLLAKLNHHSARADVEEVKVLGRDGVLFIDNERLEPVPLELEFTVKDEESVVRKLEAISDWLDVRGWQECELGWDDKYLYRVAYHSTFSIEEMLVTFGKLRLDFMLFPVKYLKSGFQTVHLSANNTIQNLGRRKAKPVITLIGNGDATITINGRRTEFRNIQNGVTIDSEQRQVYYGATQKWENLVRRSENDFPYLDKGANQIVITGNVTATMIPKWVVKL